MIIRKILNLFYKIDFKTGYNFLEYIIILKSNLFDKEYYICQRVDLSKKVKFPLWHFIRHGWIEGLSPSLFFDTNYYRTENNDVKKNPLIHYLYYGDKERRKPNRWFNVEYYYSKYGREINGHITSLEHYVRFGVKKSYLVSPIFEDKDYYSRDFLVLDSDVNFLKNNENELIILKQELSKGNLQRFIKNFNEIFSIYNNDVSYAYSKLYSVQSAKDNGERLCTLDYTDTLYKNKYNSELHYPDVYLNRYHNIKIIGNSRALIDDSRSIIMHDEMHEFSSSDYGIKQWRIFERLDSNSSASNVVKIQNIKLDKNNVIERGILICCDHDNNYFHWMVESLEMIQFCVEHRNLCKDYPLLIPKELHRNYREALGVLLTNEEFEILEINPEEVYLVNDLVLPSDSSRILDRYNGDSNLSVDIVLNPSYITKVRNKLSIKNSAPKKRKMYLTRRSGTYRRLLNEKEIELYLLKKGFEIIDLSGVSFEFQRVLFSQASVVIAPTGATLTNMVLAGEDSKFVVLHSDHKQAFSQCLDNKEVDLWGQLANICNISLITINGTRAHIRSDVHDDYIVPIELIQKYLDEMGIV